MFNVDIRTDYIPSYLDKNYILVNAAVFSNINDKNEIEYISEKIIESLKNNDRTKIAFNGISEGIPYNQFISINNILIFLIDNFSFDPKNCCIISGAIPDIKNLIYYKEHCKRFNWIEVPIIFVNWWELHFNVKLLEKDSIYNSITTSPRIKQKKFICYNRNTKPHRLYITTQCIKRDLLKDAYFSNYFRFPMDVMNFNCTHEWLPTLCTDIHDTMYENYKLFPIDLGLAQIPWNEQTDHFMGVTNDDVNYFEESYFGVVTESKYAHDNYSIKNQIHGQLSLDCYIFTEKTFKFIAAKKPFLLAGFTGSLQMLRNFGYKTFHPYIDESYDSMNNDEERIIAIVNEIERLCNLTDDEWLEWQKNVEPIVLHNYNILKNAGETVFKHVPIF